MLIAKLLIIFLKNPKQTSFILYKYIILIIILNKINCSERILKYFKSEYKLCREQPK